ncbi:MAG: GNAT family N-acetyltransferase [Parcubacteria group bacterium]|nr:GNAT family N-acetyltransferase [Parcubacteria group bacterium]
MNPIEYQERTHSIFHNLKNDIPDDRTPRSITVIQSGVLVAWLEPVTVRDLDSEESIRLFSKWREQHSWWFPAQFQVTKEGTGRWLKAGLLDKPDRMLFWVVVPDNSTARKIGHMGLFRINPEDYSCEADNIVRGEEEPKGIMTSALKALMAWTFSILKNWALELTVYEDNPRALALYDRCGFKTIKRIPLKRVEEPGIVKWEELPDELPGCSLSAERYFLKMRIEQPS